MLNQNHPRQGAGLTDFLASLFILLIVTGFALAAVVREGEVRNRVRCAANLRQLGQALLMYSNENLGAYPRTNYDPKQADKPT